jgi:glutathionylspermidine synthase
VAITDGPYGESPFVYQEFADNIAQIPGNTEEVKHGTAVLGLWMVNNKCRGMGIREDDGMITRNTSRFVPHIFE